MKHLLRITDGRKIRAYGFSKSQVSEINVYLSEENTLTGENDGSIYWMMKLAGKEMSITLAKAIDKFHKLYLPQKGEEAFQEMLLTATGWNAEAINIYLRYNLENEYLQNLYS